MGEQPKPEVCYRLYYDIFTTEFNLGFGLPRTSLIGTSALNPKFRHYVALATLPGRRAIAFI